MKLDLNALSSKIDLNSKSKIEKEVTFQELRGTNDIAVIGMACRIASSNNVEEYWTSLKNGVDCIRPFPIKRQKYGNEFLKMQDKYNGADGYYDGGFLDEVDLFDNEFFGITPIEANLMSPDQRNFLQVAWSAIEDAGYGNNKLASQKAGIYLGHSSDFGVSYKEFIDSLNPDMQTFAISGNLNSIISSRLAYLLDLKGPSMNIDTACSSALVAIHTACKALKNGECDVAIVGSSKIDNLPLKIIKKREDELGITSPDGRTRTFDFHSNGTGLGEGIGALVLKPFSAAKRDHDHIYAVIKGSAVNQDGKSANLTSPNPRAQEEVILKAWQDARVNSEMISYIEAHGTATKLGDPIEVEGITNAFRHYTDKKQFCAIGSVKSNIGHLDNAAGIAGIIKVILALQHKELPKSLHFTKSNIKIDFTDTPLYVNTQHKEWKPNGDKRLCGISAFGLSGTNCHIILGEVVKEEAITEKENRDYHILTISTKKRELLKEYIWKYQMFLYQNPDISLQDMCYTANTGRTHYEQRLAILFKSREELQKKLQDAFLHSLEELSEKDIFYHGCESKETVLVPDKVGRLRELCIHYANGGMIDWDDYYKATECHKMSLPTYPFLQNPHWISVAGILKKKKRVVEKEHPLVHECIADSLDTIIYRSVFNVDNYWVLSEHLVDNVPVIPGTTYIEMVYQVIKKHYNLDMVELSTITFINPLSLDYHEQCEVHTIVKEEQGRLSFTIASRKENENSWKIHVKGRCILEMQEEERLDIEEIRNQCPDHELKEYPYEDGKGIVLSERWNCIREIHTNGKEILAYLTLKKEYQEEGRFYLLHPALFDEAANVPLRTIGEGLYLPFSYKKIKIYKKLPNELYSYIIRKYQDVTEKEMEEYDIWLTDRTGKVCLKAEGYIIKKVDFNKIQNNEELKQITLYEKQWTIKEPAESQEVYMHDLTLVLSADDEKAVNIQEQLNKKKRDIMIVTFGEYSQEINSYAVKLSRNQEGFDALSDKICQYNSCHIINLLPLSLCKEEIVTQPENLLEQLALELKHLTTALAAKCSKVKIQFTTVGQFANVVTEGEPVLYPWIASELCLASAIPLEYHKIQSKSIDIDSVTSHKRIADEILSQTEEKEIAFRNNSRYIWQLKEMETLEPKEVAPIIKENGLYIITGGTGSLGLQVAKHFSNQAKVKLILLNRTAFPKKDDWDNIQRESENQKLREKITILQEIEKSRSFVSLYSVNVANKQELDSVLQTIRKLYGHINGVVHAAGVAGDGFLIKKEDYRILNIMEPKINGTILLDQLTKKDDLDFFIMFSSISSILPEAGQLDYAAANCFLDAYSYYRNRNGKKTVTINWPAFMETGMAVDYQVDFSKEMFQPIRTKDAMMVLDWVVSQEKKQPVIGQIDRTLYQERFSQKAIRFPVKSSSYRIKKLEKWNDVEYNQESIHNEVELIGNADDYSIMEKTIANIMGASLGITNINIQDSFQKMGGNSILAIKVEMDLEDRGINISLTDLLSNKSLKELAELVSGDSKEKKKEPAIEEKILEKPAPKILPKDMESQEGAVILEPIEPFINIIYKGCFFSALLPAIQHFGRNIDGLVFNDLITYHFQDETDIKTFGLQYDKIFDLDELLEREGIVLERRQKSEKLVRELEQSIDHGCPVIISIDCMYESLSKDCYEKEHWPHNILVYGYNSSKQLFSIIEHKDSMSTYYEKLTIGYEELVRCYLGFQENFIHLNIMDSNLYDLTYDERITAPASYVIHANPKEMKDSSQWYISQYFKYSKTKQKKILEGITCLESLNNVLTKILSNKEQLEDAVQDLIEIFNKVITGKNIETFRLKRAAVSEEIQIEASIIKEHWEKIRNVIVKYSYSKVYTGRIVKRASENMDEIIKHERILNGLVEEKEYE